MENMYDISRLAINTEYSSHTKWMEAQIAQEIYRLVSYKLMLFLHNSHHINRTSREKMVVY